MNMTTEAKQEPMAQQASGTDSNVQDDQPTSGHGGGLWILTVVLVAFAGLAAALAIAAFDGSSSNDADQTVFVDPRSDSDFHRTPGQITDPLTAVYVDPRSDSDFHRSPAQLPASSMAGAEWDNDFHRVPGQASPKDAAAEIDKDAQREANQAASQDEVEPYGSGLPHEAH